MRKDSGRNGPEYWDLIQAQNDMKVWLKTNHDPDEPVPQELRDRLDDAQRKYQEAQARGG